MEAPEPRSAFVLDELSIHAANPPRSFFLSDKRGGFFVGYVGAHAPLTLSWAVDGRTIVRIIEIRVEDRLLNETMVRDAVIRPDHVSLDFGEYGRVRYSPIEGLTAGTWGLSLTVDAVRDVSVSVRLLPEAEYSRIGGDGKVSWRNHPGKDILTLYGGATATTVDGNLVLPKGDDRRALLLLGSSSPSPGECAALHSRLPALLAGRTERMERILERSYLRLSDTVMTKVLAWARLSVDAMIVERAETLAIASLPWDGSYDGRSNLQSLAGMALIPGEYATAASVLRGWGASQDVVRRPTFGRIASRLHHSPAEYRGVDVSAWFARGLYEYVLATNDTTPLGTIFPVVRRSIEGMRRNNTTGANLVVHRSDETWMGRERFDGSPGPYAAVEVQTLWQYQQMIGGILATLRGDTAQAKTWFQGAATTATEFAKAFVDTGRSIVYDYLDGQGKGVDVLRPNGMLALDGIDGERIQQALLKRSVSGLLYPQGPGTLVKTGHGFLPDYVGEASHSTSGAVVPWLAGPFAYALTRADRQDLAYLVTRSLAERSVGRGMVGTIPEVLAAGGNDDGPAARCIHGASLLGAAEFIRAMYQDYLGIRVDAPSSVIRCEPKLPVGIRSADFTVYMGAHVVHGSYQKIGTTGRMNLSVSDVPRPVKWRFIWLFENGDAWIGAVRLQPGTSATAVFASDGMLVYQNGEEQKPEESWFVRGFARRKEIGDMPLATVAGPKKDGNLQP
jgi:glycogen debranching enzyme